MSQSLPDADIDPGKPIVLPVREGQTKDESSDDIDAWWESECRRPWEERVKDYFAEYKLIQASTHLASNPTEAEEGEPKQQSNQDDLQTKQRLRRRSIARSDGNGEYVKHQHRHKWKKSQIGNFFHGFMHLPLEVRHMIYKQCLVRGSVFIGLNQRHSDPEQQRHTYDGFLMAYTLCGSGTVEGSGRIRARMEEFFNLHQLMPDSFGRFRWIARNPKAVGLIQGVCREIHREALPIFLGVGNEFVFSVGFLGRYNIPVSLNEMREMKKVNMSFDLHDIGFIDFRDRRSIAEGNWRRSGEDGELPRDDYVRDVVHDGLNLDLILLWWGRLRTVVTYRPHTLKLDFEDCYCPLGCCRLPTDLLSGHDTALSAGIIWPDSLQLVVLYGLRDNDERSMAKKHFRRGNPQRTVEFRDGYMSRNQQGPEDEIRGDIDGQL